VIREIEIWRVAVLMIKRYADEAEANSFGRAEELAAEGDHAGAAIWRRVTVAIEQTYRHHWLPKLMRLRFRPNRPSLAWNTSRPSTRRANKLLIERPTLTLPQLAN
jgi:hypothetical protein